MGTIKVLTIGVMMLLIPMLVLGLLNEQLLTNVFTTGNSLETLSYTGDQNNTIYFNASKLHNVTGITLTLSSQDSLQGNYLEVGNPDGSYEWEIGGSLNVSLESTSLYNIYDLMEKSGNGYNSSYFSESGAGISDNSGTVYEGLLSAQPDGVDGTLQTLAGVLPDNSNFTLEFYIYEGTDDVRNPFTRLSDNGVFVCTIGNVAGDWTDTTWVKTQYEVYLNGTARAYTDGTLLRSCTLSGGWNTTQDSFLFKNNDNGIGSFIDQFRSWNGTIKDDPLNRTQEFNTSETISGFQQQINDYLNTCTPTSENTCEVPLLFHANSTGDLNVSFVNYTAWNYTSNFSFVNSLTDESISPVCNLDNDSFDYNTYSTLETLGNKQLECQLFTYNPYNVSIQLGDATLNETVAMVPASLYLAFDQATDIIFIQSNGTMENYSGVSLFIALGNISLGKTQVLFNNGTQYYQFNNDGASFYNATIYLLDSTASADTQYVNFGVKDRNYQSLDEATVDIYEISDIGNFSQGVLIHSIYGFTEQKVLLELGKTYKAVATMDGYQQVDYLSVFKAAEFEVDPLIITMDTTEGNIYYFIQTDLENTYYFESGEVSKDGYIYFSSSEKVQQVVIEWYENGTNTENSTSDFQTNLFTAKHTFHPNDGETIAYVYVTEEAGSTRALVDTFKWNEREQTQIFAGMTDITKSIPAFIVFFIVLIVMAGGVQKINKNYGMPSFVILALLLGFINYYMFLVAAVGLLGLVGKAVVGNQE